MKFHLNSRATQKGDDDYRDDYKDYSTMIICLSIIADVHLKTATISTATTTIMIHGSNNIENYVQRTPKV